ncbi:hypothetical protein Tco_0112862, partial [Tanacetum coccineum]
MRSKMISKEVPLKSHLQLSLNQFRNSIFRRRYLSQVFLTLQDETIKRIEKKLHTKKKRFALTIKDLLMNKEKLLELVKTLLNENFSAMLLKKLPEKLGDPGKFLIPCKFPGMEICYSLADLVMIFQVAIPLRRPSRLLPNEIDAYLYDKSISLESDHDDCDPEEDI